MKGNLYTLRYKEGYKGVITGWIEASSLDKAIKVGQKFCNNSINRAYLSVEPTIVADESILEKGEEEPNEVKVPDKKETPPTPSEIKESEAKIDQRLQEAMIDSVKERDNPVTNKPLLERGGVEKVTKKGQKALK